MAKSEKFAVGVDLGGTNIKIGIVSHSGKIVSKTSIKTDAHLGPKVIIKNIKKGISELLRNNKYKITGIGIGAPGVVSIKKGIVRNPPNLPGWEEVALGSIIKKEFGIKVNVENDANAAAVGELIFGAGKKYDSFVMVTLGTGVGGGIVFNRKIFRGEIGGAGEIGHVCIDPNGPRCNCGSTGCIEAYAGNHYIKEAVKKDLPNHSSSKIWELIGNDLEKVSPRIIQLAAELGDVYAREIIHDLGIKLGIAFTSISNILDIGTFIIGGGVAGFGKPLLTTIKSTMISRVLTPLKHRIVIVPAKLKNEAGILGASSLVFYNT
ncbi:MAG: ROK family protein [Ignavibacterium album]|uniref:ROK family protein n=1 Tax=Ignavibacterium album TaxID=591197 RepID=UPI0026EFE34B|nr:ROK family protein [Ignavibacterium album]MBI5662030.1 ROK family protein [Ignavibacterium album]